MKKSKGKNKSIEPVTVQLSDGTELEMDVTDMSFDVNPFRLSSLNVKLSLICSIDTRSEGELVKSLRSHVFQYVVNILNQKDR